MTEHSAEAKSTGLVDVTEGEFAGWRVWESDAFESIAGPFYERREPDGGIVLAFRAEDRHMNGGGSMHGGCIMTFADAAIFTIARNAMEDYRGVTVSLSGDFLAGIQIGQMVEARGEVTRAGGKTVFVRGIVTANGTPALSFSGIIRKTTRR